MLTNNPKEFQKTQSFKYLTCILSFILIFTLNSCIEDDIIPPGDTTGDTSNNDDNNGDSGDFVLLTQFPSLPTTSFNYSEITLPPLFSGNPITNQDNTPTNNVVSDAGATLGCVLFYDKHLSDNNTIACASCHKQEEGFSDNSTFSTGFEGGFTGRNSMGLTNAKYYENGHFFWDERAASLEQQVLMPIQDGTEMGMDLASLVEKLAATDYYAELFEDAFGTTEISAERISLSLAQFVRAMISYQSKFDEGVAATGNNPDFTTINFPNFTASENLGKDLFFSNRTNCATCHGTINFVSNAPRNNGLDLVYSDNGVGDLSGAPNDAGEFKIGSLRNVELTSPYMHDGRFTSLEQVIEHYNSGVQSHPNLAAQLRVGGPGGPGGPPGQGVQPRRLNLTQNEKMAIVNFLNTLTDDEFIADIRFSDPF